MMSHLEASATTASAASDRERLDGRILQSLGERRFYRTLRTTEPSPAWESLARQVWRASTLLWELSSIEASVYDDLLAYCAFLARELEVTESLDLDFEGEWERLTQLAPRAVAALDAITTGIVSGRGLPTPVARALSSVFGDLRSELNAACQQAHAA